MNVCFSYAVGNHHSLSLKKNIVWLNSVCEPTKRKQKVLDAYIEVWVILRGKRSLLSMVPLVGDIHMIGKLSNFQSLTDISVIWQLRILQHQLFGGRFQWEKYCSWCSSTPTALARRRIVESISFNPKTTPEWVINGKRCVLVLNCRSHPSSVGRIFISASLFLSCSLIVYAFVAERVSQNLWNEIIPF